MKRLFLCNKDLASILGVSEATITRAANGCGGKRNVLRNVRPIFVGKARRWNIALVANALGVTVEELEERLG